MCAAKHRHAAFSAGAVLVVLLFSSRPTIAQYRVTDLGDNPNVTVTAINSRGEQSEVVGYKSDNGDVRAFVWDNENGIRLIPTLGGDDARAFDINDTGWIVGESFTLTDVLRATLWFPPYPYLEVQDLGTLFLGIFEESTALGINNASPDFQIVGESDAMQSCPQAGNTGPLAFQWTQENGGMMIALGPDPEGFNVTRAYAINTPSGANPLVTVGLATLCGVNPNVLQAIAWEGTEGMVLDEPFGFAQGRDVNDAGELVGYSSDVNTTNDPRALFWSSVYDEFPVNLPTDDPGDDSFAVAINNASQIVGKAGITSAFSAHLWKLDGSWVATELNDLTDAVPVTWDNLGDAVDINDSGWIIGVGDMDTTTGVDIHVFLMTPLGDCPADIDGDGVVGIVDFMELLASWGDCSVNSALTICTSDVDGDGVVGIVDFLALLAAWGNCPGTQGPEPWTLLEELDDACLDKEDDWDVYVDVITDPNSPPFQKLRYDCWMRYYLFECPACQCATALCPGTDPYN